MDALSTESTAPELPADASAVPVEVATRDRIVAAALEVFVEKGYSGTRVQDIAERAGLTAGALYVHFPNRSRLLAEAITVEGGRIITGLIDELGRSQGSERRISGVLSDQIVAETELIDRLLVEFFALASRDERTQEQLTTALQVFDVFIAENVRTAVEDGRLDARLSADAVAAFFSSWIMGIIVHRAIARPRPGRAEMIDVVARMLAGLAPRDRD